jgi:hypothetical protein
MFFIEIINNNIVVNYFPQNGISFIIEKFRDKKSINIGKIFQVTENDRLKSDIEISDKESSVEFIVGNLIEALSNS